MDTQLVIWLVTGIVVVIGAGWLISKAVNGRPRGRQNEDRSTLSAPPTDSDT